MTNDGFSVQPELQSLEKVTLYEDGSSVYPIGRLSGVPKQHGTSFFILKLNYKLNFKVPVGKTCSCVRQEKKLEDFSEFLVLHMYLLYWPSGPRNMTFLRGSCVDTEGESRWKDQCRELSSFPFPERECAQL